MGNVRHPMPPAGQNVRAGPAYVRAVKNIERMLEDETETSQKELCLGIGMAESVFSQKKRGHRSHFYEDEFEAVAEFFRKKTGRPLAGFPHLEWETMLAIDRKLYGWKNNN